MNIREQLMELEQRFPYRERQGFQFQLALGRLLPERLCWADRALLRLWTRNNCPQPLPVVPLPEKEIWGEEGV